MKPCQYNQNDYCTHFKRAKPPVAVCKKCKFYQRAYSKKKKCDAYIFDDQWCLFTDTEWHHWRERTPKNCERCEWYK